MKINNKDLIDKLTGRAKPDPEKLHARTNMLGRLKISRRLLISAVAAVFLLVIAASVIVLLGERDTDEPTTASDASSTTEALSDGNDFSTGFLLALSKSSSEGIDFLAHMSVDTASDKIEIKALDPRKITTADSQTAMLETHFNTGGVTQLQNAVIAAEGMAAARYIVCSEENFTYFLSAIDPITLTIDEDIFYNYNGISLTIEGGTRTLTPDELMKYFCWLSENDRENAEKIEELFKIIARSFFDEEDPDRLSELYSKVVNLFSTNITAMDVSKYSRAINAFAARGAIDNLTFSVIDG